MRRVSTNRPEQTERGAETRQRILDAATDLFVERGYGPTPVSAILTAAGVTKGGFYFHFPSKAVLGREVAEASCCAHREMAMQMVDPSRSALAQLLAMPRAVAESAAQLPPLVLVGRLCLELHAEPDLDPVDPYAFWFATVTDLVRRAQDEGDLHPDLDADLIGHHLVTSYVGMDYVETIRSGQEKAQPDLEGYVRFILSVLGLTEADVDRITEQTSNSVKGDA